MHVFCNKNGNSLFLLKAKTNLEGAESDSIHLISIVQELPYIQFLLFLTSYISVVHLEQLMRQYYKLCLTIQSIVYIRVHSLDIKQDFTNV